MTQSSSSLIALVGRKGAGKDSLASVLFELGYENVKFAGGLKTMLRALLSYRGAPEDLIERMIEGDLKEVPTPYLNGRTPRHAMQTLGNEWGRECIHPKLWVDTTMDRTAQYERVAITDMRYPNEGDAVKERGGRRYRVSPKGEDLPADSHESEAHIDAMEVDGDFENDKSLGLIEGRRRFTLFLAEQEECVA